MAQASEAAEPTMEEILASIRRIIADDNPGDAEDDQVRAAEDDNNGGGDDMAAWNADVDEDTDDSSVKLSQDDLDKLFDEDGDDGGGADLELVAVDTEAEPEPAPEPEPEPAAVQEIAVPPASSADDDVLELSADQAIETPAAAPAANRIVSETAEGLVAAQLGLLNNLQVPANSRTLEDLVKELLRPMMKVWLDDNLPPLVEQMVREEIERISKTRR